MCNFRNCSAELLWKLDILVVFQFTLPEVAVSNALVCVGVVEEVFPIETRWAFLSQAGQSYVSTFKVSQAYGNAWVEPLKMISATNHEYAVI